MISTVPGSISLAVNDLAAWTWNYITITNSHCSVLTLGGPLFQSQMVQSFFLSSPSFFKHFLITYSALSNHQLLHTNREKPSNNYPAAFTSPSAPHSHNFGCFHFSTVLILFAFCICSSVNLHISNLTITFSHAAFWSLSSCSFSRTPYLHPFSFSYYGLN